MYLLFCNVRLDSRVPQTNDVSLLSRISTRPASKMKRHVQCVKTLPWGLIQASWPSSDAAFLPVGAHLFMSLVACLE